MYCIRFVAKTLPDIYYIRHRISVPRSHRGTTMRYVTARLPADDVSAVLFMRILNLQSYFITTGCG